MIVIIIDIRYNNLGDYYSNYNHVTYYKVILIVVNMINNNDRLKGLSSGSQYSTAPTALRPC